MEKCFEFNTDFHTLFVDYTCKKAFDNINRTDLINALGSYGIPKKLVRLVEMTIKDSDTKIKIGGKVSKAFNVLQGVRQGDGLSAVIFNLELDKVLKELKLNGNILYKSKQVCAYADDIALIAGNTPALQEMLITLQEIGVKYGFYINGELYMKMTATPNDKLPKVTIGQYTFENDRNFTYLGVRLNNSGTVSEEISKRIMTANRAYYANSQLLKSTLLSRSTKLKLYRTLIGPVITYTAETWTWNICDENAL
jgi:hypothetical protein